MKTLDEIKSDLDANVGTQAEAAGCGLRISKSKLLDALAFLNKSDAYRMDYISNLSATDYVKDNAIEVVYVLYSIEKKIGPVVLKVRTDRTDCVVPSAARLFRGAEYQEREAYDLFGVRFEDHPDLRRILMWEEFKGHPMRKDFEHEDEERYVEHP